VNTNSFTHQNVEPGANICYFIRAVNKEQSITASSNRSCFFSRQVNSPAFIYLRNATVPQDKSVRIDVLIDNSKSFTGIDVMRSENGTEFMKAGSITGNGDDSYTFRDATAQPTARSYYYRCIVRDSCGNPRGASNTARTIFLRLHEDKDLVFKKSLSWNAYEGFAGGVSGYNVYRMINGGIAGALIGTTGRDVTFYNDDIEIAAAKGAKIEYMVQAVEGIGNPYGIQDHSDSNPAPVYMEGTIFVPNAFAPDGINKIWRPVTHFIDKNEYKVRVFDRWGHQIFESANDEKGWDGGDVMAGVYVYLINYKNARGEYMQLKGTVTLVR
jgi:gliding motility-associated-like protein